VAPASFAIRSIRPDDILNKLSLGTAESAPLKAFLRKKALKFEAGYLARTYVLVDSNDAQRGGQVWGYITVAACDVQTTEQNCPEADAGWSKNHNMPAVKLARLAVDTELQGNDLGTMLVDFAVGLTMEHVAAHVGCRFLVTDAKQQSIGFYEKLGFTMLDTEENKTRNAPLMFVHLTKLKPPTTIP
jgi:ribosomal protein S18 acetylase RimI-like enzyme